MERKNKELKKTKKQVFVWLGALMDMYRSEVEFIQKVKKLKGEKLHKEAVRMTLQSYDDCYEWLQGNV